jgi:DDE superfamily endonuclease
MAKRKRSSPKPQLQHGKKSTPSQHDKRSRLSNPNPTRRKTKAANVPLTGGIAVVVAAMQSLLHARIGFRLPIVMAGAMLARGRRTASSWFKAAGVKDDWDRFYELLISAGKAATSLALPLLKLIVKRFDPGPDGYWTVAVDDSPTKRFGRHVEGANIHHHPTPGPADGEWLYGHNWVCLALMMTHSLWGVIALPLLSMLYVRKCDVAGLDEKYGWEFQTKHQLATRMIEQLVGWLRMLGSQARLIVVFDGAYAAHELISSLNALNITVVSRLRCNAKLTDLPPTRKPGTRGRPRKYGLNRIDLSKRSKLFDSTMAIQSPTSARIRTRPSR